ncbi:MAG: Transcription antitermination protein nusG [Microgenomates group bacterium GW2011_GWF2_45_18]|nr:MAG: Transcription antitermination protein nusG [Microgenomates group bacterium GW2011_GWF1_44_10]KKU01356.1 MAG: Transcription antitermination protein nusG [Microgenomates group bacterium GW2011_GWF2_45_18]HAU99367.1 transcription termination/antitermination factor NusG [Candidatus Paceibacterota bacterium]HAX01345.1 transcription termination/antitermination factor NusG [Candidatus Paceibacterota bacterium]
MADELNTQTAIPEVPEEQTVVANTPNHIIITESTDPKAKWYVLHTYSGHERKVAEGIRQRAESMHLEPFVLEMLIPTQEKIQIRRGKKQTIREKIFPGYLMIRMILTDQSWLAVRTTQGVTGFVGIANKPTSLPENEVKTIQKYISQGAPSYKANFSIGEAVKIVEGPFADFLGTVDSIDEEKGKVTVLVSIFGRETPVELDFLQITKI